MEIILVLLVVVAALAAAVLRTVRADGAGREPPIRSHAGWGSAALPSRPYSYLAGDLPAEGA